MHQYALEYVEDMAAAGEGDPEWCCNGVEIFETGCKSGLDDESCEENYQMGKAVILFVEVVFMIFRMNILH